MTSEQIEQRLHDINNQIKLLDSQKEWGDDVNIHMIEKQQEELLTEKYTLTDMLDSYFDDLIGL